MKQERDRSEFHYSISHRSILYSMLGSWEGWLLLGWLGRLSSLSFYNLLWWQFLWPLLLPSTTNSSDHHRLPTPTATSDNHHHHHYLQQQTSTTTTNDHLWQPTLVTHNHFQRPPLTIDPNGYQRPLWQQTPTITISDG